jgi:hypothetical protein
MRVLAVVVLASALALGACKPPGPADSTGSRVDPHALQIEIGRYHVMLRQAAELSSTQLGAPDAGVEDPKELARGLREAVWQYNIQRSQLCARNLYTETSCGPAFEPTWISEPSDARPTPEQLQQRSAEVGQEVQRFWGAICDAARRSEQDREQRRLICAIE